MNSLTKEQILGINDRPTQTISVPEWGGEITIRALSAHDRDACALACYNEKQEAGLPADYKARFIAVSVVDDSGALMFSPEDVCSLSAKNAAVIDRIFEAVQKLNLLDESSREASKKN